MELDLAIAILVNLIILNSLIFTRKLLSLYEISIYIFFISTLSHIFYSVASLNLKWIRFPHQYDVFWILELDRLILTPCLFIWVLFSWIQPRFNLVQKVVISIWWVVLVTGAEQLYRYQKLLYYDQWTVWYSLGKYLFIYVMGILFFLLFRSLIRKEELSYAIGNKME